MFEIAFIIVDLFEKQYKYYTKQATYLTQTQHSKHKKRKRTRTTHKKKKRRGNGF